MTEESANTLSLSLSLSGHSSSLSYGLPRSCRTQEEAESNARKRRGYAGEKGRDTHAWSFCAGASTCGRSSRGTVFIEIRLLSRRARPPLPESDRVRVRLRVRFRVRVRVSSR